MPTIRNHFLWPAAAAALLGACNGEKDTAATSGETGTTTALEQVMRGCPTDVGTICPWAGAGYGGWNGDDVHRLDAWFSFPMSVAFPPAGVSGDPIISDWNNHKLRAVLADPTDGLRTVMGTDFLGDGDDALSDRTPAGAPGTEVALNHPTQQVYLPDGTLLSDSWHTHKFRTWDPQTGQVHVVLGSRPGLNTADADLNPDTPPTPVEFGQDAATVLMNQPKELFVDPNDPNLVYYVDMRNERIRLWNRSTNLVDTIAGETVDGDDVDTTPGSKGYCGEGDALQTCFGFPKNANPEPGGAIAVSGDSSKMYVADSENHVIRVIDLVAGTISLLSGTPGTSGFADGPAASALWYYPSDFAIDEANQALYVADTNNHRVRKIDLNTLEVSTVAGNGQPSCEVAPEDLLDPAVCSGQHHGGDGGPATEANLYRPFGVDIDGDGNLVIADTYDHRFRIVYR
ncbi:MAG: hypothetical protein ABMA64_14145 [Myxococcota bacterium]